ncbi:spore coat protein [Peribacillus glennii]|uniref:Spore coat protein n=1 Tax=Peribacillus glennii TaxID=2303991 RepID=A0A372L9Z0_9BACI|nr:spore coat protein [Peribacillus glennii]RFU62081.1 spore coat protein [Peribacillus glennii]
MFNQQGHLHENMHTGSVPQHFNHGGHEVLDVRETLMGSIAAMNQYSVLRQYVRDPELLDIMDRQYAFMQEEYNITVDCFQSGRDPYKETESYEMNQDNDFIYGLEASQPVHPIHSSSAMNEQTVADCLRSLQKSSAIMKTMAALESTNPVVRRVLADSVPNCVEMVYELSIYQNKHHYYQVPQFTEQDMSQMMNEFAPAQAMPNNTWGH